MLQEDGRGGDVLRDIRFRAWDKVCNEMFYSSELSNGDIIVLHLDGRIEISDDGTYKPDDFVLMEFTGLKDSKGQPIYDGDVCRIFNGSLLRVVWNDEGGSWVLLRRDGNQEYWYSPLDGSFIKGANLEVIGNIYQNPELLGVTP